ncbi:MAG TPA: CAP domain-containing protein [Candidatus Limnocylindrales bacterium]|nr:CAP domain-containing protein [Candidatus Limnocylindrales bacterium]
MRLLRRRLARRSMVVLTASLALIVAFGAWPPAAAASTATDMETQILRLMNKDRVARGLVPYRKWGSLATVAGRRATRMAERNSMTHTAAGGDVGAELTRNGIQWYDWGEAIGKTGYAWGSQAAAHLYSLWKGSTGHRALLFNSGFNYVGIGVAYRSSNRQTFASIVFTDSRDHTRPVATLTGATLQGTTIDLTWSGYDPRLQVRTAGLHSFDVQQRVDGGTWTTILDDTTLRALTLADRVRGHVYEYRVRSKDRKGNLATWTSVRSVSLR